jgi:hypothetical protein
MFLAAIETIEADLWLQFAECGAFEDGEILGLGGCCRQGGQAPLRVRAADRNDGTGVFRKLNLAEHFDGPGRRPVLAFHNTVPNSGAEQWAQSTGRTICSKSHAKVGHLEHAPPYRTPNMAGLPTVRGSDDWNPGNAMGGPLQGNGKLDSALTASVALIRRVPGVHPRLHTGNEDRNRLLAELIAYVEGNAQTA